MEGVSAADIAIALPDASAVGEARRTASAVARRAGFDEARAGQVALLATEAASNVIKHGGGGHLIVGVREDRVVLTAIDRGRGMSDVSACLADGYSTSGTAGHGLGAIVRGADRADICSAPGQGTVVWAELGRESRRSQGDRPLVETDAVSVPIAGETECGDAWRVAEDDDGAQLLAVMDGLGHGAPAAEACAAAARVLDSPVARRSLPDLFAALHGALRPTRGAAIGLARIDRRRGELRYAGVGNVTASLFTRGARRGLMSQNGTVGHAMPSRVQEQVEPLSGDAIVVAHTDGITTRWSLDAIPHAWSRPPAVIAALLWRDANRGRDDATAVVLRLRAEAP